jgi:hypothetical protein
MFLTIELNSINYQIELFSMKFNAIFDDIRVHCIVAHMWRCGRGKVRCGASLVQMWWLISVDVVAHRWR